MTVLCLLISSFVSAAAAKSLSLSAEDSILNGEDKVVAFLFGPENGASNQPETDPRTHSRQTNARNLIQNFRTDKSFVLLTVSVDQQLRLRGLSD